MLKALRNERGVAMVTVLLVAAVMTVVTSTATFLTIQEFRSGADDREAGRALAYGEAGIDRMIAAIKGGEVTWNGLLLSDCFGNSVITRTGRVATGSFIVEARPVTCPKSATAVPPPFEEQRVAILARGTGRDAARQVEQIVSVVQAGLPIGVFAFSYSQINGFGDGKFTNLSLITPKSVFGRDKLETIGCDVWYTQDDFYGNGKTDRYPGDGSACDLTRHMPAAVHSGGEIHCDSGGTCNSSKGSKVEHTPPGLFTDSTTDNDHFLNCTANDGPPNSAWDGSINGGTADEMPAFDCPTPNVGKAPFSKFTPTDANDLAPKPELTEDDYDNMRSAAQARGLYCTLGSDKKITCTKKGVVFCTNCGTFSDNDLKGLGPNYFIYMDFPTPPAPPAPPTAPKDLPSLTFNAQLGSCSLDPDLNSSTVVVARNGSVNIGSGKGVSGAILAREGRVEVAGGATIHGSVIAEELVFQGSSNFLMDKCSLNNLVAPFFAVAAVSWREVDR